MGLSGSGKSTLAEILYHKLKEQNFPVEWIDGDDFRNNLILILDLATKTELKILNEQHL